MPTTRQKHLRIVCPHCSKNVSLAPPRGRLGFVRAVACPVCRIPIQPVYIKAQTEPISEQADEPAGEDAVAAAEAEEVSAAQQAAHATT